MPRKPASRHHLSNRRPLAFSRFGRSVALVSSVSKTKRLTHNSKLHESSSRLDNKSPGKRAMKKHLTGENSDQHDSSEDEDSEGPVQADFAFFDPKPKNFHGVKLLLQTYLDDKQWDLSGFVDLILGQTTVGTVVTIENDDDDGVYGFISALNLQRYKDHRCMIELKDYLLSVCPDKSILDKLNSYLGEKAVDVGLLISQRVVNFPPQLLPHLYGGLFDEISWATEDEPTEALRNSFRFKFYLVVSRIYKHKGGNRKKGSSSCSGEDIIYIKPEDELFHNLSAWSFSFQLRMTPVETNELKNYQSMCLVMAIEACKVSAFQDQLRSLIEEDEP